MHALLIPADIARDVEMHHLPTTQEVEWLLGTEALDHWDYHLGRFQMVSIHHVGVEDGPVNVRATVLAEDAGRDPSGPPIRGDVVIRGVDLNGDLTDVPVELVLEMA